MEEPRSMLYRTKQRQECGDTLIYAQREREMVEMGSNYNELSENTSILPHGLVHK